MGGFGNTYDVNIDLVERGLDPSIDKKVGVNDPNYYQELDVG